MQPTGAFYFSAVLAVLALFAVASSSALPTSASIPNVPYFRQDETFSCGAAAFQSLLFHAGRYVKDQKEIVDVLRTSPLGGTIASDISRGTFFSNLSSAQGTVYPAADRATAGWKNYTGGVPGLGLVSYELQPGTCDINAVKQLVAGGHPVLAMLYFYYNSTSTGTLYYFGHFRVIYSYNDNTQTLQAIDPWGRDGVPSIFTYSYSQFCGALGWNYVQASGDKAIGPYWATVVSNWELELKTYRLGGYAVVVADLAFPCPAPLCSAWDNNAASKTFANVSLTLTLPAGAKLTIATPKATINFGTRQSNQRVQAVWVVDLADCGADPGQVSAVAKGFTSGSTIDFYGFPDLVYPGYNWTDAVGTQATASL
ncbi:uncharacterized protein ACA1_362800 [Acanthamoeba castellanii str. Neff]|uniref:Peptidase C39-like domain-containing protein n=1 Tax=Acanthamoeba castellanii (strain ATCC 30010 / Neff) TaxID=1257118 RepID=L8GGC1_ACACF|nr:uncharacterized protein ACA1_362800 [Acanthamoeba castellanii str. Neff]ELR11793.1 hypothetical protein ACA1_362800 [Acanthamoeba castellanii str. Neff]